MNNSVHRGLGEGGDSATSLTPSTESSRESEDGENKSSVVGSEGGGRKSSSLNNGRAERKQSIVGRPEEFRKLSSELSETARSNIVGTTAEHLRKERENREMKKIITYEPTHRWWEPPLRAWFPDLNREIVAILQVYNVLIVLLGRFTNLCGNPNHDYQSPAMFCSEEWMLNDNHVLSGVGVGFFLLLAFRANNSYHRFWEGRKAWGSIKEVSRDLTRQICFHIQVGNGQEENPLEEDEEEADTECKRDMQERRRAIGFIAAFGSTLKLQLRGECNSVPELGGILCFQDILNIEKSKVMPQFCLDVITYYLEKQYRAGKLSDFMADKMGTTERIRKTPIPLSYALHLRFFLIFWLLLYPLHLIGHYGYYIILLAFLVDYAILGIESMACEIENPFGYHKKCIDLDAFCEGITSNTQEILARAENPKCEQVFDCATVEQMNKKLLVEASRANLRETLGVISELQLRTST